jgi:chemotaxis signal transduction protein
MTVLEFLVGVDTYAVPLEYVREVVRAPGRGESGGEEQRRIPVARAIGLGEDLDVGFSRGIVLEAGEGSVLLLVERVLGVRTVDARRVVRPPAFLSSRTREVVRGLVLEGDRVAVLLRPELLFAAGGADQSGGVA